MLSHPALSAPKSRRVPHAVEPCPNCGEPLKLGFRLSMSGPPAVTFWWACDTARGCEVVGEHRADLVPLSDEVAA